MRHQRLSKFIRLRTRLTALTHLWQWKALFLTLFALFVPVGLFVAHTTPAQAAPCPCNAFSAPTGENTFHDAGSAYELGVKFKSSINGYVTGVRFYKEGPMTGTHVGNLWNANTQANLATATFSSESASGWQEVTFGTPVAVTAGTLYIASVSIPDGNYIATTNYFTSDISNYPLTVPSTTNAGGTGGNGIYSTTPGTFPTGNGNGTNYWIDVTFRGNLGSTPPTVTSVNPANNATNVPIGKTLTASFDEAMLPGSFSNSSVVVKDSNNATMTGTLSYDSTARKMSFVPSQGFTTNMTYTVTLKGGSGSTVNNLENVPLASDYSWSFTVTNADTCPCSIDGRAAPKGSAGYDDTGSVELGVKVVPSENGFITALRFYKPVISTETTHIGNIWDAAGNKLASVTFTNESDYGWQEAVLATPLAVNDGQVYILSYGTTNAMYQFQAGVLNSDLGTGMLKAYASGSALNSATGSGTSNGVFIYNAGSYPNNGSSNASYYYVDGVFSPYSTATVPLNVDRTIPSDGSYGVTSSTPIRAYMDHALNTGTVNGITVQVKDASNNAVSGTVSYNSNDHYISFVPSGSLQSSQKYTVSLGSGITDTDGQALAPYSWSFTVGGPLSTDPNSGPGGPILVVTSSGDNYSKYYAEILRTEGFNYFDVQDISSVTASTLGSYRQVLLSQMSLSQSQADMFSMWVNGGGDLVAMRPDAKLAGLLGLTSAGSSRTNQYFLVNTATSPGQGITSQTMQFKGTGDNYALNGASAVATYYSDASTATSNPAVTYRTVGNGVAAAFTYDLARSVIALHQGNQAWAGQERDGDGPIRSNDLFYGAKTGDPQPDWVDLNKVQIPQADEQQRLLANILTKAASAQPIPHFWYLPHDYKAAVVTAGDDHAESNPVGTEHVIANWIADSNTNCSLVDWQCIRATHYVYTSSPLTTSRAMQFEDAGFEIGDHPIDNMSGSCNNYTSYANLVSMTSLALTNFRSKYTGLPNQRTTRYHCYVWSDWDSQPRSDLSFGIRYDLNSVTYPPGWIGSRPAIISGSGMNMRFTDASGSIIDVRQGVTNFENTVTPSSAIDGVLDNALGSNGYYGLFGTHYDMSDGYNTTIYTEATSRNVPMITSDQALTWLDGRDSSKFSSFSGAAGKSSFTITPGQGAVGLRAMMPIADAGGTLAGLTKSGANVSYQTQQVKGVSYAVFDATPGDYTATYTDYNPNTGSGGSSGTSGSTGTSNGGTTAKRVSASGALNGATPSAANAEQQNTATEQQNGTGSQNGTNNSGDNNNRTFATEAGSHGSSLGKWLIGGGIVLFLSGVFAGAVWFRHRRTPTW